MSYTTEEALKIAKSCGIAHNSGAGGQYLLCATDAQLRAYASALAQAREVPEEMSPQFTDSARGALLWVLWHHQGGSSPVGQPIRFALGMGQFDDLSPAQVAGAKRWDALMSHTARTKAAPSIKEQGEQE